ncbi:MAG: TIGR00282 family metallophosphoesterase [Sulfuricurvum sp.]|uniref:TIGR00282 family metallophosphoesterase n=1 Tax=Sulfuricurvum sp. TaxID=2025608 RepID=UPI002637E338|nr:TIGR00282 family metallophosphoesterase [Sulfuricurvum sp.]MDD2828468.1 TIGR00282 family metallophosphoesterase [Sulfuricurvum sp.]MDD4949001.1 TIGR00282 family metallophosphoesterase [Sulfuricurvum sp.]
MKIAFIGDVVGRPGRSMIKEHLKKLRSQYSLDFVIANYENASHGFGITLKNAQELLSAGIDVMSGGNHTWDKKDVLPLLESLPMLRPHNYPAGVKGTGCRVFEVAGEKLAILNIMGHYGMPYVDNAFRCARDTVASLKNEGIEHIFIDFHAEASSEKRAMLMMLQSQVSGIIGTHTHVGSDDFQIARGTAYMTDIGLTGCRDNVIGMEASVPMERFLTGVSGRFEVPEKCRKILQIAIMTLEEGKCTEAFKLKIFDDGRVFRTDAWVEE